MRQVLIVCTANICRSPMAVAVARHLLPEPGWRWWRPQPPLRFDCAGLHVPALRQRPDARAAAVLTRHGYRVPRRLSRSMVPSDFERFDLILAMERLHLAELQRTCPPQQAHKLALFLDCTPGLQGQEVPDPYFGSETGFEIVLSLCEAGVRGLLAAAQPASSQKESP